jgi:hypothetical protein
MEEKGMVTYCNSLLLGENVMTVNGTLKFELEIIVRK